MPNLVDEVNANHEITLPKIVFLLLCKRRVCIYVLYAVNRPGIEKRIKIEEEKNTSTVVVSLQTTARLHPE